MNGGGSVRCSHWRDCCTIFAASFSASRRVCMPWDGWAACVCVVGVRRSESSETKYHCEVSEQSRFQTPTSVLDDGREPTRPTPGALCSVGGPRGLEGTGGTPRGPPRLARVPSESDSHPLHHPHQNRVRRRRLPPQTMGPRPPPLCPRPLHPHPRRPNTAFVFLALVACLLIHPVLFL